MAARTAKPSSRRRANARSTAATSLYATVSTRGAASAQPPMPRRYAASEDADMSAGMSVRPWKELLMRTHASGPSPCRPTRAMRSAKLTPSEPLLSATKEVYGAAPRSAVCAMCPRSARMNSRWCTEGVMMFACTWSAESAPLRKRGLWPQPSMP